MLKIKFPGFLFIFLLTFLSCGQEPASNIQVKEMEQYYDPLLDPRCSIVEQPLQPVSGQIEWDAFWMWYPGQHRAALNARLVQKSLQRCTHVGYPENCSRKYLAQQDRWR